MKGEQKMIRLINTSFLALLLIASTFVISGGAVAQPKLRVGIIGQFSGPFATTGQEYRQGIESFVAVNGTRVGGREVELLFRDVGGPNPATAKRLAEELIVKDKVSIIGGFLLSPESFAAASVLTETKTPGIIFTGATPSIVKQSRYFVRVANTMANTAPSQAEFALKNGKKRFYIAVADYAPGIATEEAAKKVILANGGQIVGTDRIPLNTVDFTPYAERIANAKPDAVVVFLVTGAPAVSALKALAARGILGSDKVMVIGQAETDDPDLDLFDDSILGFYSAHQYASGLTNPENAKFKAVFKKKFGDNTPIGIFVPLAYDGMRVIYKMIESQQGKPFDGTAAIDAVRGFTFASPRGPVKIEADTRDATLNIYIRKVEKVNGRKVNVVVDTFPARKGSVAD